MELDVRTSEIVNRSQRDLLDNKPSVLTSVYFICISAQFCVTLTVGGIVPPSSAAFLLNLIEAAKQEGEMQTWFKVTRTGQNERSSFKGIGLWLAAAPLQSESRTTSFQAYDKTPNQPEACSLLPPAPGRGVHQATCREG